MYVLYIYISCCAKPTRKREKSLYGRGFEKKRVSSQKQRKRQDTDAHRLRPLAAPCGSPPPPSTTICSRHRRPPVPALRWPSSSRHARSRASSKVHSTAASYCLGTELNVSRGHCGGHCLSPCSPRRQSCANPTHRSAATAAVVAEFWMLG